MGDDARPGMTITTRRGRTRQFGVYLIIIGAFIPSILYPFTSLTAPALLAETALALRGVSHSQGLRGLEIVLVEGVTDKPRYRELPPGTPLDKPGYKGDIFDRIASENIDTPLGWRLAIPYRYMVALGILLAFIGIGFVAFGLMRDDTD